MSKNSIVRTLRTDLGMTKHAANGAYDLFMEYIKKDLQEKKYIRLHNFGTLHIIQCKEKKYHNPQSGVLETLPPKKRVKFRASKTLSDLVNQ